MNKELPLIEAHGGLSEETRACMGVVAEVAKILQPWHDEYCLIGGWAVYALPDKSPTRNIFTMSSP